MAPDVIFRLGAWQRGWAATRVGRLFRYLAVVSALGSCCAVIGAAPVAAASSPPEPSPWVLGCYPNSQGQFGTCPKLVKGSGSVQAFPLLYVMFWGPDWSSNKTLAAQVGVVSHFFQLLPGSDWTQNLGHYGVKSLSFGGAYVDASAPPALSGHPDSVMVPEIEKQAAAHNWTMNSGTQVIVFTQPGTTTEGSYCGVNGQDGRLDQASFDWIPYPTDPAINCQAVYPFYVGAPKIPLTGDLTATASHELAEAATTAEWTTNVSGPDQIGDPCTSLESPFDREPGAGVYVQYLLDRTSGKCADYQAIQPTPNQAGAADSYLDGVSCVNVHNCTAVGWDDTPSGGPALAEHWDGTTWAIQPVPAPSGSTQTVLSGVSCASVTGCMAVGNYQTATGQEALAESWNGTSWAIQPVPIPAGATGSSLRGVSCIAPDLCTAVGDYGTASGGFPFAEKWNGTSWAIQHMPSPAGATSSVLFGVSCAGNACTAVGLYNNGSADLTLAEAWNGTKWAIQPAPSPSGSTRSQLSGVSCTSANACVAAGTTLTSSGYRMLAETWNGTKWAIHNPSQVGGASASYLYGVSCTTTDACTAVGEYAVGSGFTTLAEYWNGSGWAIQPTPLATTRASTGNFLQAISCVGASTCTATGEYYKSSGGYRTLAEAE
jgi:hypothetical protein